MSDLEVPSAALVTCSVTSPACPDGYVCDGGLGICLPTSPASGEGAQVAGQALIVPAVVGANRRVRVEFSTDHALVGAPALDIVSGAFAAGLVHESGSGTGPFVFSYETTGGEAEGVATIRGTFADAQGRVSRDAPVGTVTLDYTAPVVDGVEVEEGVQANGITWVDSSAVTLHPLLPTGGEVPATAAIGGDVQAPSELAFAASLPAVLTAGDGAKVIQLELSDLAGNVTVVPVPLSLDTADPSNAVTIDTPTPPDVYVNAGGLTVFFHASGEPPADADGFVYSTDGGATWSPTATAAALTLSTLAQDADTVLWIRERDVFGNLTAPASQGVLSIHEDSQPPSTPHSFTSLISGLLTSEVGVLLDGAVDPGGGPVTYQLIGGPYADYTAVSTEPRIVLPGAAAGSNTVYLIRAVDRAGNPSNGATVTVADSPFQLIYATCTGGCFAYEHKAGADLGVFASLDPGVNQNLCAASPSPCRAHTLNVCMRTAADAFGCSSLQLYFNTAPAQLIWAPNVGGHVLTYMDASGAPIIRAKYLGPDNSLSTVDDGPFVTVGNGSCSGPTADGVFFGNSSSANRLTYYSYGNDKQPGTADTGESTVVVSAASLVNGFNPCYLQTAPNHVMWRDTRAAFGVTPRSVVYNLGADGKPGGGDDGGEWVVPGAADSGTTILGANRVIRASGSSWLIYGGGPDQLFGNGDDTLVTLDESEDLPPLTAADGDKAYATGPDVMFDLTTHRTVPYNNESFGGAHLSGSFDGVSASGSMIFGAPTLGPGVNTVGAYNVYGEPFTFQVANASGEGGPSGTLDGEFFAFIDDSRATFLNTRKGGSHALDPNVTALSDMDIDGGYFVWLDETAGAIMLYYAGADGVPSTSDDKGPTQVAGPGTFRWPRVDGHLVVWADLSADGDGNWFGANLDSRLKALDLGADGWVGGGDDVSYSVPAGTKVVTPDISGTSVAYFDYADDTNGTCTGGRGVPDPLTCTPSLKVTGLAGGVTTILAGGAGRADLQFEGNHIVFSESSGANWHARIHTLGVGTVTALDTGTDQRIPTLVGESLAYFSVSSNIGSDGVFVTDSGPDTTFGTVDDIVRRGPSNIMPRGCGDLCTSWDGRPHWFDGEVTASGGGLMPVDTAFDTATGSAGVPLVDNGTLTDSATLAAPPWQHIEDMRVRVRLSHATPSQLEVRLVSPNGERLVLASSVAGGSPVDVTYTVENAPNLFGLHGDPLAGTWQLEVQDKVAGVSGTLTGWSISHRR